MEDYLLRNEIEQELRRTIAKRIDTTSTAIDQLFELITLQKKMIDSLERRVSGLESRNTYYK